MKFDRFLDKIAENFSDERELRLASLNYRKNHGHFVFFDGKHVLSDEEKRIEYLSHAQDRSRDCVCAMCELLDFDRDQNERAFIAARALLRWYNRTAWERCPSSELVDRLEKFVMG